MPFIKQQATTALAGNYRTTSEAIQGIEQSLRDFYAKYPAIQPATLNNAVQEVERIYSSTIFPEMKVDWRTHPDHIGHFYFPGCFRCHDGQHTTADGRVLSNDCTICHSFVGQETGSAHTYISSQKFEHPGGELPEGVKCMECHTGGVGP